MKCHYEVLDVSRTADDAAIKASYRKLALKWHPDKNLDNPEVAKEQFQIVQQAYEVLSDKQERAWYDKHREQILRGANTEFEDKSLDLFQYFTTTCFKGYDDDDNGFYAVYRKVFEVITKEDIEFMEDKEEFCEIPDFGDSKTDPEKVAEFYVHWSNYTTKKSYVWLDPYDITEIKDRRFIKQVQKENKKVRQKAKKERNEEVRNLVAFVKKRDKRVQVLKKIQEEKLLEDKRKRELLRQQKRLERQELNTSATQPEWAKFDNVKSELEKMEKKLAEQFGEEVSRSECEGDDDDDDDLDILYCVACNKLFKTIKAFQNHEFSKKHRENMQILKETMLKEEKTLENEQSDVSDDTEDYMECHERHDFLEQKMEKNIEEEMSSDSELSIDSFRKARKKKKPRNILSVDPLEDEQMIDLETSIQNEIDKHFEQTASKKTRRRIRKAKLLNGYPPEIADSKENKDIQTETKKSKKKKKDLSPTDLEFLDTDHSCITCKVDFPSKNKLFDHLKKTGHGVHIPPSVKNKIKKKSNKEK